MSAHEQFMKSMYYAYVRERKFGFSVIYPENFLNGIDERIWIDYISDEHSLIVTNKNTKKYKEYLIDKKYHNAIMTFDVFFYMLYVGLDFSNAVLKTIKGEIILESEKAEKYLGTTDVMDLYQKFVKDEQKDKNNNSTWNTMPKEDKPFVLMMEEFARNRGTLNAIN